MPTCLAPPWPVLCVQNTILSFIKCVYPAINIFFMVPGTLFSILSVGQSLQISTFVFPLLASHTWDFWAGLELKALSSVRIPLMTENMTYVHESSKPSTVPGTQYMLNSHWWNPHTKKKTPQKTKKKRFE